MTEYRSPLLDWPGAVAADGPDAGIAWHYGDPLREQRLAATRAGLLDDSHREILMGPGVDRLGWLHAIVSQHVANLRDGDSTETLVLSPNGHVEQHWRLTELTEGTEAGEGTVWIDTEPGQAEAVLKYLLMMRFLKRVEPAVVTEQFALLGVVGPRAAEVLAAAGIPVPVAGAVRYEGGFVRARADGRFDVLVPRARLADVAVSLRDSGAVPVGSWGAAARRVEARQPRLGLDTDHRTIPHEVGWIGSAVHLDKGCYRGQETVARVQNLGRPPRRLVLLHLSGDSEQLPVPGTPIERDGRAVGFLGTAVHHFELGPVGLAVVKRGVGPADTLTVGGQGAALDPDDAEPVAVEGFAGTLRG